MKFLDSLIHLSEIFLNFLETKGEKFGVYFVIGGAIGSIVTAVWKKMSLGMFLRTVFVSMFIGWVTGVLLRNYTSINPDAIYAIVSMAGAFSYQILEQVEKLLKNSSDIITKKLDK